MVAYGKCKCSLTPDSSPTVTEVTKETFIAGGITALHGH